MNSAMRILGPFYEGNNHAHLGVSALPVDNCPTDQFVTHTEHLPNLTTQPYHC